MPQENRSISPIVIENKGGQESIDPYRAAAEAGKLLGTHAARNEFPSDTILLRHLTTQGNSVNFSDITFSRLSESDNLVSVITEDLSLPEDMYLDNFFGDTNEIDTSAEGRRITTAREALDTVAANWRSSSPTTESRILKEIAGVCEDDVGFAIAVINLKYSVIGLAKFFQQIGFDRMGEGIHAWDAATLVAPTMIHQFCENFKKERSLAETNH